MPTFLDFEKPIAELEGKIAELRHLSNADDMNIAEEITRLQSKVGQAAEADLLPSSPPGRRRRSRAIRSARISPTTPAR